MSSQFIKVLAATTTIAALPVLAQAHNVAYGTSSPVEIVTFDVAAKNAAWTGAAVHPASAGTFTSSFDSGSIMLRFVNRREVPATSVIFVVNDGSDNRSIVDKGRFSPGVLIEHRFNGYLRSSDFSWATFAVAEVDFADGTSWHAARTLLPEHAGSHATGADSAASADTKDSRRGELEELNAEARRVAFRRLGTSL